MNFPQRHHGLHDRYSAGPFCRVEIFLTRDGLQTFVYRGSVSKDGVRVESPGSLVNTVSSTVGQGPMFINTDTLRGQSA